jgi:hypothetical protein
MDHCLISWAGHQCQLPDFYQVDKGSRQTIYSQVALTSGAERGELLALGKYLVGADGIEPSTYGLRVPWWAKSLAHWVPRQLQLAYPLRRLRAYPTRPEVGWCGPVEAPVLHVSFTLVVQC